MTVIDATKPHPASSMAPSVPFKVKGITDEQLRVLHKEANTLFDLFKGPMVRTMLLKTGPKQHMLLLSMHHAVCDGWSLTVMMSEAVVAYNSFLAGSEPWLNPLPIQYSDYAMWHDDYLAQSRALHVFFMKTLRECCEHVA